MVKHNYIPYRMLICLEDVWGKRHKRCICCNKVNNHPARGHRSPFSPKKQDAEQEDHEFTVSKGYKAKL